MTKIRFTAILFVLLLLFTAGCGDSNNISDGEKQGASDYTAAINEQVYDSLNFSNKDEVMLAQQDCVDNPEAIEVKDSDGNVIYSQKGYSFVNDLTPSPKEVNPSLWNNTQLNHYYGLFAVEEDFLYQVRGYDVTNLTVITTDHGYIVINPMSNVECAKAAMQLIYKDIGVRPVLAVIITSPSVDCWGGIAGLKELNSLIGAGSFEIIAPDGFQDNVIGQNTLIAQAAGRLSDYENGYYLEKSTRGALSTGDSLSAYSGGTVSYISPTRTIKDSDDRITIGSVKISFQLKNINSTSFMNVYIENSDILYLADNSGSSMQNLFDLSSGITYCANDWSQFLLETLTKYGYKVNSAVQAHNWAHKGNEAVKSYIKDNARAYKFIHDQTVCAVNQGMSKNKIIENIRLPEELSLMWYLRQYSGTLKKCVENVYDTYMKDYKTDFTQINPMSDSKKAEKFIEYMGGDTNNILKKAKQDFDNGEYQWVCEITNIIIKNDENNTQAKYLCADALEQLAYISENGVDRNLYLTYSEKLRGNISESTNDITKNQDMRKQMSVKQILDIISTHIDSNAAAKQNLNFNIYITDEEQNYSVEIQNGVMIYYKGNRIDNANASLHLTKNMLFSFIDDNNEQQQNILVYGDKNIIPVLNDVIS